MTHKAGRSRSLTRIVLENPFQLWTKFLKYKIYISWHLMMSDFKSPVRFLKKDQNQILYVYVYKNTHYLLVYNLYCFFPIKNKSNYGISYKIIYYFTYYINSKNIPG